MCDPVSIMVATTAAVSIGSAVVDYESQNAQHDRNKASAEAAAKQNLTLLDVRKQQEQGATAQTVLAMDMAARRAQSQTALQAGAAGVGGTSVDLLMQDIDRQKATATFRANQQLGQKLDQIDVEKSGVVAQEQDRINAVPGGNPWALGLRIVGAAAQAGSSYMGARSQGASGSAGAAPGAYVPDTKYGVPVDDPSYVPRSGSSVIRRSPSTDSNTMAGDAALNADLA